MNVTCQEKNYRERKLTHFTNSVKQRLNPSQNPNIFGAIFQLQQQCTSVCLSACSIEKNTLSHKAVDIATALDAATESLALADVERDFEL